jgi:hypothetical protein
MSVFVCVGIDNGVSGSLGFITSSGDVSYYHTPIKKCLNYNKEKKWINRVDYSVLYQRLFENAGVESFALIERPLVNPAMFNASASALRAFEATIIVLENLAIGYEVIDSKEWQKELLPHGLHKEELKVASLDVAKRLFPKVCFKSFKDADGLLIAEYCRRISTKEGGHGRR